jgi:hypothetical protein
LMARMNKKTRDDLRSLAAVSTDRNGFELRARFYFAASRLAAVGDADTHGLMREAVMLFTAVKAPLEFTKRTNIVEHPSMTKR